MSFLRRFFPARAPSANGLEKIRILGCHPEVHSIGYINERTLWSLGGETLRIWDTVTLRELHNLGGVGFEGAVSPDGETFATVRAEYRADIFSEVVLFELAGGFDSRVLPSPWSNLPCSVEAMVFSPDGTYLACSTLDLGIHIWSMLENEWVGKIAADDKRHLAFALGGSYLLTTYFDRREDLPEGIRAYALDPIRLRSERPILDYNEKLVGHQDTITALAVSPDGRTLVSGSKDRSVRLWDLSTWRASRTLSGHDWDVEAVACAPDGIRVASCTEFQIVVWDLRTGDASARLARSGPRALAFSPDSATLAFASAREGHSEIGLWRLPDLSPRETE